MTATLTFLVDFLHRKSRLISSFVDWFTLHVGRFLILGIPYVSVGL